MLCIDLNKISKHNISYILIIGKNIQYLRQTIRNTGRYYSQDKKKSYFLTLTTLTTKSYFYILLLLYYSSSYNSIIEYQYYSIHYIHYIYLSQCSVRLNKIITTAVQPTIETLTWPTGFCTILHTLGPYDEWLNVHPFKHYQYY